MLLIFELLFLGVYYMSKLFDQFFGTHWKFSFIIQNKLIIKKTTKIFHLLSHMSVADTQFALTANVLRAQFSLNFDTLFFSSQCRVIFANTVISLRASLHTRVNSRKGHTQLTSICHGGKRPKRTCHCHRTRSISRSAHHSILVYMESGMAEQSRRNSSVLARELLPGLLPSGYSFRRYYQCHRFQAPQPYASIMPARGWFGCVVRVVPATSRKLLSLRTRSEVLYAFVAAVQWPICCGFSG